MCILGLYLCLKKEILVPSFGIQYSSIVTKIGQSKKFHKNATTTTTAMNDENGKCFEAAGMAIVAYENGNRFGTVL